MRARWSPRLGLLATGVACAWLVGAAHAGVRPEAYAETVRLVQSLYLYPDEVDAGRLLRAAASGLAERVDWLMIEHDAGVLYLQHGDGTHLGSLSVASLDTLPAALMALEDLVRASGFDVGDVDVRLALLQGMTGALDRYSTVLAGDRLERFDVRLKGTLVGIGLTFRSRGDALVVREVVPGGPAAAAGLVPGDVIVRIDGLSTVNLPDREAARRISGEAGTRVGLTLQREGGLVELFIERQEIVVPNVEHRGLAGGVGYVRITHFSQRTDENLRVAIDDLTARGEMSAGLVIDLRGNTGGSMKDSARAADELLHEGVLLRTSGSDGQRVRNLQSRMDATSVGNEPDVPVVVLMDGRTASGSEIMAGALRYLDRAALLGSRSFGKGTVQKVYAIDPLAKLKLTVARYLLADDRPITDQGLAPDVLIEDIVLDRAGVRVRRADGEDEDDDGAPTHASGAALPVVVERAGWRPSPPPSDDARLELARRAVLGASGSTRAVVLASLERAADEMRKEQAALLREAIEARDIDWTAPTEVPEQPGPPPRLDLSLRAVSAPGGEVEVQLVARSRESKALSQVWVELDCATFGLWRGIAFPLGRLAPGAEARGTFRIRPAIGLERREDEVVATVRAAGRAPSTADPVVLAIQGPPEPELGVSLRYVATDDTSRAEVAVRNLGEQPLSSLEVAFGHPGDLDLELLTHAALVPDLAPGASARVALTLDVGPTAPERLPLGLVVTRSGARSPLVEWPVALPRDGSPVELQAPRIAVLTDERSASVGTWALPLRVTDETAVDHVVVYVNGEKVAWEPGGEPVVGLVAALPIGAGRNRVVIVAYDTHGISRRRTIDVRGEQPMTVDAE